MDVIAPPVDQNPVFVLGMVHLDFKGAVVDDQRIVCVPGLLAVYDELIAVHRHSINRFAGLLVSTRLLCSPSLAINAIYSLSSFALECVKK
jgi:hypothetical protein